MNVSGYKSNWNISGVGGKSVPISEIVDLNIESRVSNFNFKASFGVIEHITEKLPFLPLVSPLTDHFSTLVSILLVLLR
jgi:hypothetical protein